MNSDILLKNWEKRKSGHFRKRSQITPLLASKCSHSKICGFEFLLLLFRKISYKQHKVSKKRRTLVIQHHKHLFSAPELRKMEIRTFWKVMTYYAPFCLKVLSFRDMRAQSFSTVTSSDSGTNSIMCRKNAVQWRSSTTNTYFLLQSSEKWQ